MNAPRYGLKYQEFRDIIRQALNQAITVSYDAEVVSALSGWMVEILKQQLTWDVVWSHSNHTLATCLECQKTGSSVMGIEHDRVKRCGDLQFKIKQLGITLT